MEVLAKEMNYLNKYCRSQDYDSHQTFFNFPQLKFCLAEKNKNIYKLMVKNKEHKFLTITPLKLSGYFKYTLKTLAFGKYYKFFLKIFL